MKILFFFIFSILFLYSLFCLFRIAYMENLHKIRKITRKRLLLISEKYVFVFCFHPATMYSSAVSADEYIAAVPPGAHPATHFFIFFLFFFLGITSCQRSKLQINGRIRSRCISNFNDTKSN